MQAARAKGTRLAARPDPEVRVRLVVDLTRCQGYAQCAFLAPDAFTIHGDEALIYDPEPGDAQRRRVRRGSGGLPGASHPARPNGRRAAGRAPASVRFVDDCFVCSLGGHRLGWPGRRARQR